MSKTIKNVFVKKLDFILFIEAHNRAKKSKMSKKEVLKFELDLETNLINLMNKIKNGSYKVGKYRSFTVYEPKERLIKSLPYCDRIVHQWYVEEFIKPFIVPRFISDTYACIEGRGTHKAVFKLQEYMRIMKKNWGKYYIVKCDIKKFFYNIDRNILFNILKKYFKDKKLLAFTHKIIFDNDETVSIPIGNYTSQYFANIYLNELDHYVKEKLKIKYYIRYMDDFIFLVKTKEEAKYYKDCVENFVNNRLNLELNPKSKYFPNYLGIEFCGYKIYETHLLLKRRCKLKIKKNINKWNKLYLEDRLDSNKVMMCWNSWVAHSEKACNYNLKKILIGKCIFKDNPNYSFLKTR